MINEDLPGRLAPQGGVIGSQSLMIVLTANPVYGSDGYCNDEGTEERFGWKSDRDLYQARIASGTTFATIQTVDSESFVLTSESGATFKFTKNYKKKHSSRPVAIDIGIR